MFSLNNVKMKPKLIGLFLLAGLLPLAIVGWWSSTLATRALMAKSYAQLEAVREIKKSQIEKLFLEREGDMGVIVDNVAVLRSEALRRLGAVTNIKTNAVLRLFQQWEADVLDVASEYGRVFQRRGERRRVCVHSDKTDR